MQRLLATEKINRNQIICGAKLTDEQVAQVKDGQFLYIDNLQDKNGKTVAKYVFADHQLKKYWLFDKKPDQWVKYGHYEMRIMDKVLIEAGFITHVVIKWWGGMGQTAVLISGNKIRRIKNIGRVGTTPENQNKKKSPHNVKRSLHRKRKEDKDCNRLIVQQGIYPFISYLFKLN